MINLDHQCSTALYLQIYEQLRAEILSGAYPAGAKLSPIRTLAADLSVSRNTVEAAYLQLTQEGYVASRTGSGYTVQELEPAAGNADAQRQGGGGGGGGGGAPPPSFPYFPAPLAPRTACLPRHPLSPLVQSP